MSACCRALRLSLSRVALPLVARHSSGPAHRLQPCRAASGDGGGGAGQRQIAPPDVRELARMAHISVTDAEVAEWGPKIESIVDWFGQLQEVDVEGVPPALRADVEGQETLRPDVVVAREGQPDLLDQAPDREGPFVRVPKIATAVDN